MSKAGRRFPAHAEAEGAPAGMTEFIRSAGGGPLDTAPTNEVENENDHRDDENNVNEPSGDFHDEPQQPKSEQDKSDSEKHTS